MDKRGGKQCTDGVVRWTERGDRRQAGVTNQG